MEELKAPPTPKAAALPEFRSRNNEDNQHAVGNGEEKEAVGEEGGQEEEEKEEDLDGSPLWQQRDEDGWELTWPIWHMLPRDERKALAKRHGYKTIGEFEEYMSLQQAVGDSETKLSKPYPNNDIYRIETDMSNTKPRAKEESKKEDDLDDNNDGSSIDEGDEFDRQTSSALEELSYEELLDVGGKILMLHDELLHQIFSWLPVDTYGTLALVSPHWKNFTRTEMVYKRLCERLYLNQSKRRQLHVSRFGGSYRRMLEVRPRVRAAGGCYVLKYAHVKKIQRDMWTEIPHGAILETVYYRYLYFQEDGRVLYALSSAPPHLMFRRLLRVCVEKVEDPVAVWGTFQVQKNHLTVHARQEWHSIRFDIEIEVNSLYGRFGSLVLLRHLSSPSGCFEEWSHDLVDYKVPTETFRFVKDGRL